MKTIIEIKKSLLTLFIVIAAVVAIFFAFPAVSDDVMSFFGVETAEACCGGGDGGGEPPEPECPAGTSPQGRNNDCRPTYSQGSYGIPATCDKFEGDPLTLPYGGGDVTLEWMTTNATAVTINNGVGSVADDGSTSVSVTDTTTFTLTAQGTGGNDSCQVTITVEPQDPAPSCDKFEADPTSFTNGTGGSVTLTWMTTNGTSVSIDNGVGTVSEDGSTTVNVTGTIMYTLTVTNATGSDTCKVTITVTQDTEPNISIIKRDAADKDDIQTVAPGGTANFEIVVTNTGVEDLKDVVVTDPLAPNCDRTIGNLAVGDSFTYECTDPDITSDYTNTANVTGKSVVDDKVVSDSDPSDVTVSTPGSLSCDSFTANDTSVRENAKVTLTWSTTGATSASISPDVGTVATNGSVQVIVERDTTYVLTISDGSSSKTCEVSIDTDSGGGGGGGGSSAPRCDLDISDEKVKAGDKVTLSWDTSRATEIEIEDDNGKTIFESDKKKFYDGEIDVIVYEDTRFTLTAKKGSRKKTCRVEVEVEENEIEVFEKRDQPLVISLTEVPYTGFEAGPTLTAIFYALLAFWALFITYILVIRKDSIFGFALSTPVDTEAIQAEIELKKKVKMLAARANHQHWN